MSTQDDAQVQVLKTWWKSYGNIALIAVVLVVVLVYGFKFWNNQKHRTASSASMLYQEYQQALHEGNVETLDASFNALQSEYNNTPYAAGATLIEAARAANTGDFAKARTQLQWVLTEGEDFVKPIARLRLAELAVQTKDYDEALAFLGTVGADSPYKAAYTELEGDIYVLKGNVDEALDLYREALTAYQQQGFDNLLLQYKLQTYAPGE